MLVLSRKIGERIWIGEEISVTVVRMSGGTVRLGIQAPKGIPVVREELRSQFEGTGPVSQELLNHVVDRDERTRPRQ